MKNVQKKLKKKRKKYSIGPGRNQHLKHGPGRNNSHLSQSTHLKESDKSKLGLIISSIKMAEKLMRGDPGNDFFSTCKSG